MATPWDDISRALVAAAGVAAAIGKALSGRSTRSNRRHQIKQDIEIMNLLPKDSDGRAKMQEHIDASITRLIADEDERRRDPFGMTLALVFIGLAVWAASFPMRNEGSSLWWLVAIPLGVIGLVGFVQDATPRKRNERGQVIRE